MDTLKIQNLTKTFRLKKGRKVEALKDLSLTVRQGEVFGFLGPNGAGKSTTIKTLMGLIRPTSGIAEIFGLSVADHAARKRVGYLPENPSFYEFLTALEYLAFVGQTFGMAADRIKSESERVLKLLDLADAANRPIRGYSKGMVQRLGLAQALLHDPDLYILDEPMSGLDPIGRALVKDIIRSLKEAGKTVFFSTHITADVEIVCDRVGVIVQGVLRVVDEVQNILRQGIEGYVVHVRNVRDKNLFAEFHSNIADSQDTIEVYVTNEDFSKVIGLINESGGYISLVEPKRKDLEVFFLDIVSQESK